MAKRYMRCLPLLTLLSLALAVAQPELADRNDDLLDPSTGRAPFSRSEFEHQTRHRYARESHEPWIHTSGGHMPLDDEQDASEAGRVPVRHAMHPRDEEGHFEEQQHPLEHPRLHTMDDAEDFELHEAVGRHIPAQHLPSADPTHDPDTVHRNHHYHQHGEVDPAHRVEASFAYPDQHAAGQGSSTSSAAASSLAATRSSQQDEEAVAALPDSEAGEDAAGSREPISTTASTTSTTAQQGSMQHDAVDSSSSSTAAEQDGQRDSRGPAGSISSSSSSAVTSNPEQELPTPAVASTAAIGARGPGLQMQHGDTAAAAAAAASIGDAAAATGRSIPMTATEGDSTAAAAASSSTTAAAAVAHTAALPEHPDLIAAALDGAAITTQAQQADPASDPLADKAAAAEVHTGSTAGTADGTADAANPQAEQVDSTSAAAREQQPEQGSSTASHSSQSGQALGAQQLPAQGSGSAPSSEEHWLNAIRPEVADAHQQTASQQAGQQQERHQGTTHDGQATALQHQELHQPEPLQMLVQHDDEPQDVGGAVPDDSQAADTQAPATQAKDSAEHEQEGQEVRIAAEQETAATEHEDEEQDGHLPAEDEADPAGSDRPSGGEPDETEAGSQGSDKPSGEEPVEESNDIDLVHQQHADELTDHQELEQEAATTKQQADETALVEQQHEDELGNPQDQQAGQPQQLPENPGPLPLEPQAAADHEEDHDSNYHADQQAAAAQQLATSSQEQQQQPAVAATMTATGQADIPAAASLEAAAASAAAAAVIAHDNEPALLGDKGGAIGAAGVTRTSDGPALHPQPTATAAAGISEAALMLGSGPPQGTQRIVHKSLFALLLLMLAVVVMLALATQRTRRSFGGRKVNWEDPPQDAGIMATAVTVIRDLQASFIPSRHPILPISNTVHAPLLDYCAANGLKEKRDSSSDGGDRESRGKGRQSLADVESSGQRGSFVAMRPGRNLSKTGAQH